jgi:hypothetical protein
VDRWLQKTNNVAALLIIELLANTSPEVEGKITIVRF